MAETEAKNERKFLNVDEVADILNLTPQGVTWLIRNGSLHAQKVNPEKRTSAYIVYRKVLERYIEKRNEATGKPIISATQDDKGIVNDKL